MRCRLQSGGGEDGSVDLGVASFRNVPNYRGVRGLPHAFIRAAIVLKQTECNRGHSDEHASIFFIFVWWAGKKVI